ncbi:kinase-like domain-containing protein, partial [Tribonema minus]
VQVGKLGKGASASVFKAVDMFTLKLVAVKVIKMDRDSHAYRLIRHEVTALRSQRAPLLLDTFGDDSSIAPCDYITQFYGCAVDKSSKQASIAMEYECCGSLEEWCRDGLPTPEPWLAHVAYSILQ